LKKEDEEHEETIRRVVNTEPPSYPYTENIPCIDFNEGIIALMWDKRKESLGMTREMTTHGLALTSSIRS
jgi:hypothetical protein